MAGVYYLTAAIVIFGIVMFVLGDNGKEIGGYDNEE
jgi:hypothetical protein